MAFYDYPTSYVQPSSISLTAKSAVGVNTSAFTFAQQSYAYEGQRWDMMVNFPPMKLDDAQKVISFFLRLNGREHYFNLIHPEEQTQTLQTNSNGVTLQIDSSNSTNKQITLDHTYNNTGSVPVGSFISILDPTNAYADQLVQVTNAPIYSQTNVTKVLDIWPYLPGDIDDYDNHYVYMSPNALKGTWRLKSNQFSYDVNEASIYGMSIACESYVRR
jgi:hypothetical protein